MEEIKYTNVSNSIAILVIIDEIIGIPAYSHAFHCSLDYSFFLILKKY